MVCCAEKDSEVKSNFVGQILFDQLARSARTGSEGFMVQVLHNNY